MSANVVLRSSAAVWTMLLVAMSVPTLRSAAADLLETQELVEGVRLLAYSDTLETLRRATKPELSLIDADGTPIFVWTRLQKGSDHWTLIIDTAHRLKWGDRIFWGFLDASSDPNRPFHHPIEQFLALQFVREQLEYPGDYGGDANHSSLRLLSESQAGARVFELVYCSLRGWKAHQEGVKTYLLYRSPEGKIIRASEDLGHQGNRPHSGDSGNDSLEMEIVWLPNGSPASFEAKLRRTTYRSILNSENDLGDEYTTHEEGTLSGRFPMRVQWSPNRFLEGDGESTLARIAEVLTIMHSSWCLADWVPESARTSLKNDITSAWLRELQRCNPGLDAMHVAPKGQRMVAVNEYEFSEKLYERFRPK